MLVNVFHVRTRLVALVDRGVASQREVNQFVLWLAGWFVIAPLILGAVGFAAGWSSPFCGGVMEFGTSYQILASVATVAVWASVLWWVWRGAGADFLSRAGPALATQPSYEKRYSPQSVRLAVTASHSALVDRREDLVAGDACVSRYDLSNSRATADSLPQPAAVLHLRHGRSPRAEGYSRANVGPRHAPTRTS